MYTQRKNKPTAKTIAILNWIFSKRDTYPAPKVG